VPPMKLTPLRAEAPAAVERYAVVIVVGLLALAAWVALDLSAPYGLHHLHHLSAAAISTARFQLTFIAGWTIMTLAMMLPASLPVVATLHVIAGERADRLLLVSLAVLGYMIVWISFGALVLNGYGLLQRLEASSPWLASHEPAGAPLLLLLAGAFQFSSLKYKCLEKCRSPFSFVIAHWQGSRQRWQAFRLGIDHGIFCVGCCWALMLMMFVVGAGSLVWMLILALIMAIEKNIRWGRYLSKPVGAALLAWGVILLVFK
jgi:predicted metal-binding membrane protein